MLIYFLVEDSQGNFTVSPLEKSVPCSPPERRDSDNNSWDSNLSAKWDQFTSFSESLCLRAVIPQNPHPCFLGLAGVPRLSKVTANDRQRDSWQMFNTSQEDVLMWSWNTAEDFQKVFFDESPPKNKTEHK